MTDHSFRRAELLLRQKRYGEAAEAFKSLLADDPDQLSALLGLAFCYYQSDDERDHAEALRIVRRASAIAPEDPHVAHLRGLILAETGDLKGAHASMDAAIALEPDNAHFFGGRAMIFLKQQLWSKAEEAARQGLALDPEDEASADALASALLMQGNAEGHSEQIAQRLARDPEDPRTHFNMGMAALRAGRHLEAETHFRESLRLAPGFEPARQGLLEAFRSRSPPYRAFLRFSFWLSQLSPGVRTGVLLGAYVAYRLTRHALEDRAPTLAIVLAVLWVSFALFSFLGRGLGNLIILVDRTARHALNARERWEGLLVGGGMVAGLTLVVAGLVAGLPGLSLIGACLAAPAVPASVAFAADRRAGRRIYGTAAVIVAACALVVIPDATLHLSNLNQLSWSAPFLALGAVTTVVSIWAAFFGFKTD